MATPPNGYRKIRISVSYENSSYGRLTIYRCAEDSVHLHWECWHSLGTAGMDVVVWRDGELDKENILWVAQNCSNDDVATMEHWLEEEIMQFIARFVPVFDHSGE
jgi:hypothetical protein